MPDEKTPFQYPIAERVMDGLAVAALLMIGGGLWLGVGPAVALMVTGALLFPLAVNDRPGGG